MVICRFHSLTYSLAMCSLIALHAFSHFRHLLLCLPPLGERHQNGYDSPYETVTLAS